MWGFVSGLSKEFQVCMGCVNIVNEQHEFKPKFESSPHSMYCVDQRLRNTPLDVIGWAKAVANFYLPTSTLVLLIIFAGINS